MAIHSKSRAGVSMIELLIVLAIIGTLVSLGVPALMRARENARAKMCLNNLHQMGRAIYSWNKKQRNTFLTPPPAGKVGGWTYHILPYIEEKNLQQVIPQNALLSAVPAVARNRPRIMNCPLSPVDLSNDAPIQAGHYDYGHRDVPITHKTAWLSPQDIPLTEFKEGNGPHDGEYRPDVE